MAVIDLLEPNAEFNGHKIIEYEIGEKDGSAGRDFSVTVVGIDETEAGSLINFAGITDAKVTQKRIQATPNGYTTQISGVDEAGKWLQKAPGKTINYMTMTESEKYDFDLACTDESGVLDYDVLDYVPKIKICRDDDFTEGWNSFDVIQDMCQQIGCGLVCNVYTYWLKQVNCDIGSSFFETIKSIVGFLEPTIYFEDGTLYIINKPYQNGEITFTKIQQLTQIDNYNINADSNYIKFSGGLGQWNREKVKGVVGPQRQVTLETTSSQDSQVYMTINMKGDTETIKRDTGEKSIQTGQTVSYTVPCEIPKVDRLTRSELILLDPFGNRKAILSSHLLAEANMLGTGFVPVKEEDATYEYDFLDEPFEHARETRTTQVITERSWNITQSPGGTSRMVRANTSIIETKKLWAENGNLLREIKTRQAKCLRLGPWCFWAEVTYIELSMANIWWEEGQDPPEVVLIVVEEEETVYRQLTSKMYEKAIYRRSPEGLRVKQGEELRSTKIEHIRGRVPRVPCTYRKSQVYAENHAPISGQVMAAPGILISNPNVINWSDAEAILDILIEKKLTHKRKIQRQLDVPADLDIDLGWGVTFPAVTVGQDGMISAMAVTDGKILNWKKVKAAGAPRVSTVITLEGLIE